MFFHNETWRKSLTHEVIIFTKFHKDWTKIVDFLLMANFWKCPVFFCFRLYLHQQVHTFKVLTLFTMWVLIINTHSHYHLMRALWTAGTPFFWKNALQCTKFEPKTPGITIIHQAAKLQKSLKWLAMSMILTVLMINSLMVNQLENLSW